METTTIQKTTISVHVTINESIEKVWKNFISPGDIVKWYYASDDWHAPSATNDLKEGGKFNIRMEAKDGSFGFDFEGIYDKIKDHDLISYSLADGRKVKVQFLSLNKNTTEVLETFDAENENPIELQRAGWQAILDNFKKYVEMY